jgi:lysozyme family protein
MVPPAIICEFIEAFIRQDEGGWVLTQHPGEQDGGWTFAGITAKLASKVGYDIRLDVIKEAIKDGNIPITLRELIFDCYYTVFYKPLKIDSLPIVIRPCLFSAGVNIGVGEAVQLAQIACNCWHVSHRNGEEALPLLKVDGKMGEKTLACIRNAYGDYLVELFLREWHRHYIRLVKFKPTEFNINRLEGWFNRVERYRP